MTILPTRAFAAALLAITTWSAAVCAQHEHPTLAPALGQSEFTVAFELGNPTIGKHAMLVCYVDIVGDTGNLSQLIKKSIGAVSSYTSVNTSTQPFTIPGVDTTDLENPTGGVPEDEVYTVPPSIIANALAEIEWGTAGATEPFFGYLKEFDAAMSWDSTDMTSMANALPWPAMGYGNSSSIFDLDKLLRACLARQITYMSTPPTNPVTVLTQVEAIMMACMFDAQTLALNAVVVEVQNGGPADKPTTPRIKLSRNVRIELEIPGGGGNGSRFFDWNCIYPVFPLSTLAAELMVMPEEGFEGIYRLFVPTTAGYVAVDATLCSAVNQSNNQLQVWLEATMPPEIMTGPFAAWSESASQYLPLRGYGPESSTWVFFAPHPVTFVAFPMMPF